MKSRQEKPVNKPLQLLASKLTVRHVPFRGVAAEAMVMLEQVDNHALSSAVRRLAAVGDGVYSRISTSPGSHHDHLLTTQEALFSLDTPRLHEAWINEIVLVSPDRIPQALYDALAYGRVGIASTLLSVPPGSQQAMALFGMCKERAISAYYDCPFVLDDPSAFSMREKMMTVCPGLAENQGALWWDNDGHLDRAVMNDNAGAIQAILPDLLAAAQGLSSLAWAFNMFKVALEFGSAQTANLLLSSEPDLVYQIDSTRFAGELARAYIQLAQRVEEPPIDKPVSASQLQKLADGSQLVSTVLAYLSPDQQQAFRDHLVLLLRQDSLDEDMKAPPLQPQAQNLVEGLLMELRTPQAVGPARSASGRRL